MSKEVKKQQGQRQPTMFVAIGYDEVYDDFAKVNPLELIEGIPTVVILKYVAEKYASVFYSQSDRSSQRNLIYGFCPHLPPEKRQRVWRFVRSTIASGNHVFLFGAPGCLMLYRLALQTYTPLEEDDDVELCEDEYEPLFKALLYCNKLWTDQQVNLKLRSVGDISLKIDIPIVEGKQYKDFRPQLYKAHQFFTFCENDATFKTYLPNLMQDKGVKNWGEYIMLLFNVYSYSIQNCILPHGNVFEQKFLSQFVIDLEDAAISTLWNAGNKGIDYLRNHFLFTLSNGDYLLLDANLLIDKLYQGLKFDLFKTIQTHGLLNAKGKPYKDLAEFNSTLGTMFSERHLLYELLAKTYSGGNAVRFTGDELKAAGIVGEPDYYMRIDQVLFLIEYKDLLFPDTLRFSDDVDEIKQGILDRLCLDDGKKRKGGGQLLFTIDRVLNQGLMDGIDVGVKDVKCIFPLIVTTDRAFSAMGVNLAVIEAFDKIMSSKYKFDQDVFIVRPVVVNLDSLIKLSYRLSTGKMQLTQVLTDYIDWCWKNISSFDNYVYDECKESKEDLSGSTEYLFSNLVGRVAQMTTVI